MILEWPLTDSPELAEVLRPGGHIRPDSALRALKHKALGPVQIAAVPRGDHGAHGRKVWYSSLMLDVVRLFRAGNHDPAAAVLGAASALASHRSSRFVADWLADHHGSDPDPTVLDAETGGALTHLALRTAQARLDLQDVLGVESYTGKVSGGTVSVRPDSGTPMTVPVDLLGSMDDQLVAITMEPLDGGSYAVWVRPAFESLADPHERVPGDPVLLSAEDRVRLADTVTSAS